MAGRWKSVDPCGSPRDVPRLPACYVVYCDGKAVYVGQTNNLAERLVRSHGFDLCRYSTGNVTPWGYFNSVVVKYRLPVKYGDWAMVEMRLIRRLQPVFNKRGVKACPA